MKNEFLQMMKTVLLGLLTLLLLTVTVLELLPGGQTALTVKDTVAVAPSVLNSTNGTYQLLFSGTLINQSDESITVDAIDVKVSNGKEEQTVRIPLSITLQPREEYELSHSEESKISYSRIQSMTATVGGEQTSLSNANGSSFGTVTVLFIALTLIAGFLFYRCILVYHYMKIEKKQYQA